MSDITKIDKNFLVEKSIQKDGMKFFDIENPPFKIYGIKKQDGMYRRMPEDVAKSVSDGVYGLHTHTAGGRVRFKTNSRRVSIIAKFAEIGRMQHFAVTGSAGFDLYVKEENGYNYHGTYLPSSINFTEKIENDIYFENSEMRDITINFPTYSKVTEVYIGILEDTAIEASDDYKNDKPIVYYGSSITQGGCCSRPGNIYQNIISRRFDVDYINLGFSGSARAEDEIIEYIKNLSMSIFVLDYDHNAPSVEHLKNTHEKMFKAVREAHPEIPIIIISRPKYTLTDEEKIRLEIITETYKNALESGDKNVYLLDGPTLMAVAKNDGTVDNCHPNDLGFYSMACALGDLLSKIL